MKPSLVILCSVLASVSAFADTAIYRDGEVLKAAIDSADSERLYKGLEVVEDEGRSGLIKFFETADRKTSITCTYSTIPGAVRYACTLSIDPSGVRSETTPVFEENGSLHASINADSEAQSLFDSLVIGSAEGRSGTAHFFYTTDTKASVHCTHSSIPVGIQYGCRVSIQSP